MDVNAQLTIAEAEQQELAHILECDKDDLADRLAPFASAALREYVTMILGQKVFNRGTDIREYRLFLLINEVFDNQVPPEEEVSRLFQTTSTESRSLIRSVVSKYQYQVQQAMDATLQIVLDAATQVEEGGDYRVSIKSQAIVEALNRKIGGADGTLQPVRKVKNSVSTYAISPASYQALTTQDDD